MQCCCPSCYCKPLNSHVQQKSFPKFFCHAGCGYFTFHISNMLIGSKCWCALANCHTTCGKESYLQNAVPTKLHCFIDYRKKINVLQVQTINVSNLHVQHLPATTHSPSFFFFFIYFQYFLFSRQWTATAYQLFHFVTKLWCIASLHRLVCRKTLSSRQRFCNCYETLVLPALYSLGPQLLLTGVHRTTSSSSSCMYYNPQC